MCCFIDCFGSLGLDSSQCLLLLLSFMVCVDVRFLFSLNPHKNCCWLSGTNCGCTWQLPGVWSFKSSQYAPNQTVWLEGKTISNLHPDRDDTNCSDCSVKCSAEATCWIEKWAVSELSNGWMWPDMKMRSLDVESRHWLYTLLSFLGLVLLL